MDTEIKDVEVASEAEAGGTAPEAPESTEATEATPEVAAE